jgi:hypothetical protein
MYCSASFSAKGWKAVDPARVKETLAFSHPDNRNRDTDVKRIAHLLNTVISSVW